MVSKNTLTAAQIADCLVVLPPVELIGLALLRQYQAGQGGWFPAQPPKEQVVQATVELIAYSNRAVQAAQRLSGLRAIPLTVPIVEYPL